MKKFRLLVPNIIRVIAALAVVASLIELLCDIANPIAWAIAFGGICSSVLIFGFASLVQAAEYYIFDFLFDPNEQAKESEECEEE